MEKFHYGELTSQIINAFYKVYNVLGYGFLEKVYENALRTELASRGFSVKAQAPIAVFYENVIVGEYFADLIVNNRIILEIKSADHIAVAHKAQLVNYLKATGLEVGLVLNFGVTPSIARKINQTAKQVKKSKNKSAQIQ